MKNLRYALILLPLLAFPGCGLADAMELACLFMDDPDHCYQAAAVQGGDPYGCEKIKGEGFKGSNPPRDKCYLQIAENTGDYEACKHIKGGPMSYTVEECITGAAVAHDDPDGCRRLKGSDFDSCKGAIGAKLTADRLRDINEAVEEAKSAAGKDPDDEAAAARLKELLAKQKGYFEFAPDGVKGEFFKAEREAIMEEVDDEDVKSEIARQFMAARGDNPNMSLNDQLAKMKDIRDRQMTAKRLDDEVNGLMDELKESASGFASDTVDDLYGDDLEEYKKAMAEKGMKFLEEHGGDRVKRGIEHLEYMKGKYDKASEQYEAIAGQIEKLKKVYDEVSEVYGKIDEVNKLLASGRIDAGKAKVLHGAIYLGKGLEYATGYVPVFGSTVSKISKEMMDATVRLAQKRAERTTAINKCIEDPEHCDPNDISAY
jgi:hypothetical protein